MTRRKKLTAAEQMHTSEIHIGPMTFTVTVVPDLTGDGTVVNEETRLWGEIAYGQGTIRIEEKATSVFQKTTLMHEIVHGILEVTGQGSANTEPVVNALAYSLVDLFTRNPWLLELLSED